MVHFILFINLLIGHTTRLAEFQFPNQGPKEAMPSAVEAQSPNSWTTREFPDSIVFIFFNLCIYFFSRQLLYFLKKKNLFIFIFGCIGSSLLCEGFLQLWRAGATLHHSVRTSPCGVFSCCGAWALGTWAPVVVARGLSSCGSQALECRLSSCGAWAQLLHGMWDLPGPELEPVSPALAGGFLTPASPGQPSVVFNRAYLGKIVKLVMLLYGAFPFSFWDKPTIPVSCPGYLSHV